MNETSPSIMKYILIFSAIYAGIMLVINILLHGFDINLGTGANIGMLIGAAYGAMVKFVTDGKRAPLKRETRLLSFGCLMSSVIISTAVMFVITPLVAGSQGMAEIQQLLSALKPLVWVSIFLVVGVIYYFMLSLVFGWVARKYANKAIASIEG